MFQPRHPQPFSLAEAEQLDVSTIVAEISRLRNSISHLDESQSELLSALEEEEDADLRSAWQENQGTIASQNERIAMLTHVLEGKVGRDALGHYGITPTGSTTASSAAPPTPASPNPTLVAPTPTTAIASTNANGDVEMANGANGANGSSDNRPNGDTNEDEGVFL
ncbi:hypothetical protein A1Q1_08160 [Trichosporon asahii var. asahii CBS 2479]|uniref:Uncharacterized protein n=1 Tax=Trichosporon asahii var. asahii (strain ATCC 90039 / CBS 2479 / JCM 2466 / KCTC 7840 / NBRC 103889/ NCYC 2677 / UAMH 7654) TaxID=1186058 RepID=J5R478_TRIAS|nr:hypothetical protein A1Q1_08160 [Trichosporon asahii var. asahii CBS 2479]EJT50608.1 hypothetical protein A1Q1_08160 [Trichosporon asahii var. asahii CBS 2479]